MKQKLDYIVSGLSVLSLMGIAACSKSSNGNNLNPAATTTDVSDVALPEGDTGTTFFDFVVSLSEPKNAVVTVDFGTVDGTAEDENGDGDYNSASGTLSFEPGTTTQIVRVLVNGDIKLEGDETFTLELTNLVGSGVQFGKSQGVGTILDDEVVAFTVDDSTVLESDFSSVMLDFTVNLLAELDTVVTVDYATNDLTAKSGFFFADYQSAAGTLVFDPGVTQATIRVTVFGDLDAEPTEYFSLDLSNPQGAGSTIANGQGIGTILDNNTETQVDTDPLTASHRPQMAVSGPFLYAAWYDNRNGAFDVYFSRSTDGGSTWSAEELRLDTDTPGASASTGVQISAVNDNVYAVWEDLRNGASDIYFNYSNDNGQSWQASDLRIDTDGPGAAASTQVRLATFGSDVYVAWIDTRNGSGDVYFNYSNDGGLTWQVNDIRLDTDAPGTTTSSELQMTAAGDQINVVWVDNGDIYSNFSSDGGATWQPAQIRVDTDPAPFPNVAGSPRIAANGTNVYVVWQDERNGAADIYFNQSFDGGATFGPFDRRLDTNDGAGAAPSTSPAIAADGFNVYVTWQDNREIGNTQDDIYFNSSADGGISWLGDYRIDHGITAGKVFAQRPVIACEGLNVAVVWSDRRNGEEFDLYATTSNDGGQSFLSRLRRLDSDAPGSASSTNAVVLANEGQFHVLWEDQRAGGDIFHQAFVSH